MTVRLQKYLAECGLASRRGAEELISAGRVRLNGAPAVLGQTVDPVTDCVEVDGKPIGRDVKIYVLLNKPPNVVTTAQDTHGRRTVMDCVAGARARVFPVGRLDMDTRGVILLTNDGEMANRLMHPKYGVRKVYEASVAGTVTENAQKRLENGVDLEDGRTAPARVTILKSQPQATLMQLVLHEGRKREVKRMCAAVGHPVMHLRRIAFADLRVTGLREGEWRYLSEDEIIRLRKLAGL